MKIIPLKTHILLDYLLGIILISAPWVFNFTNANVAVWFSIIAGINILLNRILTGVIFTMRIHLTIDIFINAILLLSPWIFGFSGSVYLPHLLLGAIGFITSILTEGSHHGFLNQRARLMRSREASF
jgi:hypothetical protein